MKHTHVIEAASAEEFKSAVYELYHAMNDTRATDEAQPPLTPATAEEKAAPAKKSKKAKEEVAPVAAPVVATVAAPVATPPAVSPSESTAEDIFGSDAPAPTAPPAFVPYTMEDCQKRLQAVVTKHNITKAKELLAKFSVGKLVELPKEKYNDFISAADELT